LASNKKRVFVSFAVEDKQYRDLLGGHSQLGNCPIEYADFSVKEPWDNSWKTRCRQRIKGCDAVIALLSKNTQAADGARWEIKCGIEEAVPVLGVYIHQDDDYTPPELVGKKPIRWTWDGVANFIDRL